MTKPNLRNKIIVFEVIYIFVLFLIFYYINHHQEILTKLSNQRIEMYFAADRLRHSSDDLTISARNYIATKDKEYKYRYFSILNIRNGITPRPKDYHGLYWELNESQREKNHPLTKNLSLKDIFNSLPFTKEELFLLQQAHKNSDKLADLEKEAFHLVESGDQNKAIQLMFSKEYLNAKQKIMAPIDEFIIKVDDRMEALIKQEENIISLLFIILILLSIFFIIINVMLYKYISKINKKEIKEKNDLITKIHELNQNLENKVEERTQKLKEAMRVKNEFLANMSHEIRTPLNAMFGFIQILHDKDLDKESKSYLNIIEKSGENLLSIINDILDFSKIEAGKLKIEKIEFNPKEEIEVIYNLFQSKASEKNILLKLDMNLEYNIVTDPLRLKQIIANLISNAIKFTPNGKNIELFVNYNSKDEKLYIEIKDEGIGIEKNKLDHIFDEFSQADTSTTRKYGGTGLGLSISYKLVKLLGGELKVESEIAEGSKFYFTIPAKKKSLIETDVKVKKINSNVKYNYHVLLVEDNKANQMFMKVILKQLGITFDIANNGAEAVEMYKNNKYNFILMDENMPVMSGIEATKNIRKYENENNLENIIIIALTANALAGDKEKFLSSGMDYYLTKPLNIEKLKNILSDF